MYCDYHTHTPLCLHASGTPQEYVQAAVRAGLREYGISDHAPMPGEPFDDWRMKQADMPAYLDWLTEARECAALHGLTVRSALECDWFPGIEPWIEHLQGLHAWDYLIGSVHYLGEKEEFRQSPQDGFLAPDGCGGRMGTVLGTLPEHGRLRNVPHHGARGPD